MAAELQQALDFLARLRRDDELRAAFEQLNVIDEADPALAAFLQARGYAFDPRVLPRAYDVELRMRRAAWSSRASGQVSVKAR